MRKIVTLTAAVAFALAIGFTGPANAVVDLSDGLVAYWAFDVEDAWFSNHHAVFMGTVRFTLVAGAAGTSEDVTFEHSVVFVTVVLSSPNKAEKKLIRTSPAGSP